MRCFKLNRHVSIFCQIHLTNDYICQMIINKSSSYSIKEAAEITNISGRTLTRLAVKLNKEKIDGKYFIEGEDLINYLNKKSINVINHDEITKENEKLKSIIDNQKTTVELLSKEIKEHVIKIEFLTSENAILKTQKDLELESLKIENEKLKKELKKDIPHQEKLKMAIKLITLEAMEKGVTHKVFTDDEYQDLIGTISEVDFQKEQVQYLRTRVEKQDVILEELVKQTTQRNFLEAKEKGFDKE